MKVRKKTRKVQTHTNEFFLTIELQPSCKKLDYNLWNINLYIKLCALKKKVVELNCFELNPDYFRRYEEKTGK